ncbi:unnamed protein product [Trichogramma brassicae]|uniref:Endonuclease/exonuclease/phosphatase domain-containing protein n=1 Tax=Trichogramma brassicae TaxID=86971 RepID=A0A6H5IH31_9HYME|nr:unnamed protein product [Trichogramma brassicae]
MNAILLPAWCSRDLAVIKVELPEEGGGSRKVVVALAYFPCDSQDPPPTAEAQRLIQHCQETRLALIIGCDANSHHTACGCSDINSRGEALLESLASSNLIILNRGSRPTFRSAGRETIIDLTLCSQEISHAIRGWRVSQEPSLSDHHQIHFAWSTNVQEGEPYRNPRRTDWALYKESLNWHLEGYTPSIKNREDCEEAAAHIRSAIMQAYEASCLTHMQVVQCGRRDAPPSAHSVRRGCRKETEMVRGRTPEPRGHQRHQGQPSDRLLEGSRSDELMSTCGLTQWTMSLRVKILSTLCGISCDLSQRYDSIESLNFKLAVKKIMYTLERETIKTSIPSSCNRRSRTSWIESTLEFLSAITFSNPVCRHIHARVLVGRHWTTKHPLIICRSRARCPAKQVKWSLGCQPEHIDSRPRIRDDELLRCRKSLQDFSFYLLMSSPHTFERHAPGDNRAGGVLGIAYAARLSAAKTAETRTRGASTRWPSAIFALRDPSSSRHRLHPLRKRNSSPPSLRSSAASCSPAAALQALRRAPGDNRRRTPGVIIAGRATLRGVRIGIGISSSSSSRTSVVYAARLSAAETAETRTRGASTRWPSAIFASRDPSSSSYQLHPLRKRSSCPPSPRSSAASCSATRRCTASSTARGTLSLRCAVPKPIVKDRCTLGSEVNTLLASVTFIDSKHQGATATLLPHVSTASYRSIERAFVFRFTSCYRTAGRHSHTQLYQQKMRSARTLGFYDISQNLYGVKFLKTPRASKNVFEYYEDHPNELPDRTREDHKFMKTSLAVIPGPSDGEPPAKKKRKRHKKKSRRTLIFFIKNCKVKKHDDDNKKSRLLRGHTLLASPPELDIFFRTRCLVPSCECGSRFCRRWQVP